jgi:hypothetical protein
VQFITPHYNNREQHILAWSQNITRSRSVANMVAANCFVCISRAIYSPLLVLFPIKGFCPHSKSSTSVSPTFKIAKLALVVNLLVSLSLLYPTVSCLSSLMSVCGTQKSLCLIILGDQMFIISSILLEIIVTTKVETLRREMLTWSNIFQHRRFYGLGDITDKKKSKRIVMARSIFLLVILVAVPAGGVYFFSDYAYDRLPLNYARNISLCFFTTLQSNLALDAYQRLVVVGAILNAMETTLHETFLNRNVDVFKRHVHLIAAINCNVKSIKNILTGLFTLWILTITSFLICNIYALVDHSSHDFLTIVMTQVKTINMIIVSAVFFFIHDEILKRKVSPSLSQFSKSYLRVVEC